MRDITGDERQRLGPQSLAAQPVAAARTRQLRCGLVGMNHIPARVDPCPRRGSLAAPRRLRRARPGFCRGLLTPIERRRERKMIHAA